MSIGVQYNYVYKVITCMQREPGGEGNYGDLMGKLVSISTAEVLPSYHNPIVAE